MTIRRRELVSVIGSDALAAEAGANTGTFRLTRSGSATSWPRR